MRKIVSLVLVLLMVFSLANVAFAYTVENETNHVVREDGSIYISGHSETATYKIYKLLHLEGYVEEPGKPAAYTYKVESAWEDFFKAGTGALDYVTIDAEGYVSWKESADPAAFAQLALAWANTVVNAETGEVRIDPLMTNADVADFTTTGTFSGLTLGYYLVDTSVGALCGLTTAKPTATVAVKNGAPSLDKQVEEDANVGSGTNAFGDQNTADIGQVVNYDVTIVVANGAQNYVYHDTMSEGLTLDPASVKVYYHVPGVEGRDELDEGTEEGDDYQLVINPADGHTFDIVFSNDYLKTINDNDRLFITYSAKLNEKAVIAGEGNPNEAWVSYGDNHTTTHDKTTTYTYGFEIFKTDSNLTPLVGAEFKLYDVATGGEPIKLAYNTVTKVYRRATALKENETWAREDSVIVVENADGTVRVVGLDNGNYYLEEIKAPDGYKLLSGRQMFTIRDGNLYVDRIDGTVSTGHGVRVENNTGVTLPTTGSTGTTLFITFGMIVALGTGVLLVTKKRMSMIQE